MTPHRARKIAFSIIMLAAALTAAQHAMADPQTRRSQPANQAASVPAMSTSLAGNPSASGHGIDEMYDLVLKRCNDAGGGMVNYPEGYRCEDGNGNQVPY